MKKTIFVALTLLLSTVVLSQVGLGTTSPHASAQLDVTSTTKGFLLPRMTNSQKAAIASPAAGLIIWCTNCGTYGETQVYNGTTWVNTVGGAISASVPDTPTGVVATPSNTQVSVAFTAPTYNGGSTITGYTVTSSSGSTFTGTNSPIVVTGLTNGTLYTFTVVATNAVGNSASASVTATPFTVPDAPTGPVVTADILSASVAFTAPAFNGGGVITGYTVTSSPGSFTGTGSATPITVTGLSAGTAYTFTVVATNAAGSSVASSASAAVTPYSVPDAPTSPVATAAIFSASVAFTAPTYNGGKDITGYTVTSSPGSFTATGSTSPLTVTGLTAGTAYTFTVVATNVVGSSVASSASTAVTPYTVPDAPTTLVVRVGYTQASIAFTAPAFNGGSAITGYTVTSSSGSTVTGTSSPIVVTGLTNGTPYTFTVKATNVAGSSVASSASEAVTPNCGAYTSTTVSAANYKVFACYNLGATETGDPMTYQSGTINGDLYQWGRPKDGHEKRDSNTVNVQATIDNATEPTTVVGKFIIGFSDWRVTANPLLWTSDKTVNDPCPDGFKVPHTTVWRSIFGSNEGLPGIATTNTWTWTGNGYIVGTGLYLPATGIRNYSSGTISDTGTVGYYWCSHFARASSYTTRLNSTYVWAGNYAITRGNGCSVRCVKI